MGDPSSTAGRTALTTVLIDPDGRVHLWSEGRRL
jgi:hypothetical protein